MRALRAATWAARTRARCTDAGALCRSLFVAVIARNMLAASRLHPSRALLAPRFLPRRRFSSPAAAPRPPDLLSRLFVSTVETLNRRRGLVLFAVGFFFGGGGLSGLALLQWNLDAAEPPGEDKATRRRLKAEAKLAAREEADASCAGVVRRWVWGSSDWWLPHWQLVEAEVRRSLLLYRSCSSNAERLSVEADFASGGRCSGVPLAGCRVVAGATQPQDERHTLEVVTEAGAKEQLLCPSAEARERWGAALRGASARRVGRRRVVDVAYPSTWEAPYEVPRLVKLEAESKEYRRVERLAVSQQLRPKKGVAPYVKGQLSVKSISRVQSPHVWEQYCMRRAILGAENEGEPSERFLWHGTTVPHLITKEGFDPRVCALSGMFGGGVYFADKSTKSLRYSGASKPGDKGVLLLSRVALGRPMLKYLPQTSMRRPPDPFPLFGVEHFSLWLRGQKVGALALFVYSLTLSSPPWLPRPGVLTPTLAPQLPPSIYGTVPLRLRRGQRHQQPPHERVHRVPHEPGLPGVPHRVRDGLNRLNMHATPSQLNSFPWRHVTAKMKIVEALTTARCETCCDSFVDARKSGHLRHECAEARGSGAAGARSANAARDVLPLPR